METRVIICGSREFDNKGLCFAKLDEILSKYENVEIISGQSKGADLFGEEYAQLHSLKMTIFPANWKRYGKTAGPIRNKAMLMYALEAETIVIAFWNGSSRGTKNMIEQAEKQNVRIYVIDI